MKVSTKFKVDTIIRCIVVTLFLLIRYVTLWPWLFDLDQWSHMAGHVVIPSSLKILRLSILELWVMTSLIWYHWQCVCSHCACAVSRDLWLGANFSRIFEIPDPDLPIRYATFMALRLRQMELLAKTVYGPVLKITKRSEHAQNHISVQRCRKSFTMIFLGNHDFLLMVSNFDNWAAFRAIVSHMFTAHAQKRLSVNFWLKLWHHHSIPWPRSPYRSRYFDDLRTFSVDFALNKLNVRHISTPGLVDLLT